MPNLYTCFASYYKIRVHIKVHIESYGKRWKQKLQLNVQIVCIDTSPKVCFASYGVNIQAYGKW